MSVERTEALPWASALKNSIGGQAAAETPWLMQKFEHARVSDGRKVQADRVRGREEIAPYSAAVLAYALEIIMSNTMLHRQHYRRLRDMHEKT